MHFCVYEKASLSHSCRRSVSMETVYVRADCWVITDNENNYTSCSMCARAHRFFCSHFSFAEHLLLPVQSCDTLVVSLTGERHSGFFTILFFSHLQLSFLQLRVNYVFIHGLVFGQCSVFWMVSAKCECFDHLEIVCRKVLGECERWAGRSLAFNHEIEMSR